MAPHSPKARRTVETGVGSLAHALTTASKWRVKSQQKSRRFHFSCVFISLLRFDTCSVIQYFERNNNQGQSNIFILVCSAFFALKIRCVREVISAESYGLWTSLIGVAFNYFHTCLGSSNLVNIFFGSYMICRINVLTKIRYDKYF